MVYLKSVQIVQVIENTLIKCHFGLIESIFRLFLDWKLVFHYHTCVIFISSNFRFAEFYFQKYSRKIRNFNPRKCVFWGCWRCQNTLKHNRSVNFTLSIAKLFELLEFQGWNIETTVNVNWRHWVKSPHFFIWFDPFWLLDSFSNYSSDNPTHQSQVLRCLTIKLCPLHLINSQFDPSRQRIYDRTYLWQILELHSLMVDECFVAVVFHNGEVLVGVGEH